MLDPSPEIRRALSIVLVAGLSLTVAACSDDSSEESSDAGPRRDRGVVDRDPEASWDIATVDGPNAGLHTNLLIDSSDTLHVAFWTFNGEDVGPCDDLMGLPPDQEPPPKVTFDLRYGTSSNFGASWDMETAITQPFVGSPPGMDFKFTPGGNPAVAVMVGQPEQLLALAYCGAHDAGYHERMGAGNWQTTTLVTGSGEAATGEAGSDFGLVVGNWPSFNWDNSGTLALVYRDIHSGGIQSDDLRRADLEMSYGGNAIAIDFGRGAGIYSRIVFDSDNRPTITYYVPTEDLEESQLGIWVTRSPDGGTTWEQVKLFNEAAPEGPDILIDSQERLHVAYYDSNAGRPIVATLMDDAGFTSAANWEFVEVGDSRYDEGYQISMAEMPDGRLAAAYFRCNRASAGLGECNGLDSGLVIAWEDSAGGWRQDLIEIGESGATCGNTPDLAFDSTGHPVIAYRCQVINEETRIENEVRIARRQEPLE